MRQVLLTACRMVRQTFIPLFAKGPSHPFVPLGDPPAIARKRGQGRPSAGACALPLTAASTVARWHQSGDRACSRFTLLAFVGTLAFSVSGVVVGAQAAPTAMQAANDPYAGPIAEAAQRFGIPTAWIRAVMRVESGGDRRAVSPKGAMGLMQVMPENWTELRARYGLGNDSFDPHDNIVAGTALLRELHDRYGVPGFLAAYNAGPGRYEDYRDQHRPLPAETVAYVANLAPLLACDVTEIHTEIATADLLAWTSAPLFIAHPKGADGANRDAAKPPPDRTPGVIRVSDLSAIAPQSDGLFVVLSARNTAP
jgi:hypothetical protein